MVASIQYKGKLKTALKWENKEWEKKENKEALSG